MRTYYQERLNENEIIAFLSLQCYWNVFKKMPIGFREVRYNEDKCRFFFGGDKDDRNSRYYCDKIICDKSLENIGEWIVIDCDKIVTTDGESLIILSNGEADNVPNFTRITVLYSTPEEGENVLKWCTEKIVMKAKEEEISTNQFYLMKLSMGGLTAEKTSIDDYDIDIKKNYNNDFPYEKICSILEDKSRARLMLFHGIPGTGKTMFLRHLIWKYSSMGEPVYYLDSSIACECSTTVLIEFFKDIKNSIIVIEDGEKLLTDRRYGALSAILNVTDGILGDVCKNKFVFTFNCHKEAIDSALLRKGRLALRYEFGKLKIQKARAIWKEAKGPMTLADLYNHDEENEIGAPTIVKAGFKIEDENSIPSEEN